MLVELVKSLIDGAMQLIARRIAYMVVQEPGRSLPNLGRLYLAEKGAGSSV
jgi:hypothetical protein